MDQDAQPAGRHRRPVPADPDLPEADLPEPDVVTGRVAATTPGSASSRDVDLARFLTAAREQAAPAAPRFRAARRSRGLPDVGRPRGGRGSVVQVCLLGLLALLVLWLVHTSGRGPAAAGGDRALAVVPVTATSPQPTASPQPALSQQPTASPQSAVSAVPARSAGPTATRRVAVVPVAAAPSWPEVVTALFRARSMAFARGRPALLLAADAVDSPVLMTDRRLFATAVRSPGYQRVDGLGFDLSAIRAVSQTAAVARLEVTGRQRASRLVGPAGIRAVPAGPVRTVLLELRRAARGSGWRIQNSTVVRVGR